LKGAGGIGVVGRQIQINTVRHTYCFLNHGPASILLVS
jgi:hypothetical protein